MIQNIYETHLQVADLDRAIQFYSRLDLELSLVIPERKAAFFYVGKQKQMLGLWEVPEGKAVQPRHFAFGTSLEEMLKADEWLRERGIAPEPAFSKEPVEPLVHTWMPAACVYFSDPDGNQLELIAWLEGEGRYSETVPYLSEWQLSKLQSS